MECATIFLGQPAIKLTNYYPGRTGINTSVKIGSVCSVFYQSF